MKKIFGLITVIIAIMESCNTQQNVERNITYKIAERYFFNNNAEIPENPIVTNQTDFDKLYGAAAVMGKNGRPGRIDFSKVFVIGIVLPETNNYTEIIPDKLTKQGDIMTLNYTLQYKEKNMTWTMRPMSLIIVDKIYMPKKCELKLK